MALDSHSPRPRRSPLRRRAAGIALAALLAASIAPLRAHDFWIEPSTHRPEPGQKVAVRLRVGEHYLGDSLPRNPARIERFWSRDGAGEREVPGVAGTEPAGWLEVRFPGVTWIVYDGLPARLELGAAAFERYLNEEGLERIVALRRARGQSDRPGRELFSRCAKALLTTVGVPTPDELSRPLGLELELLLESAPDSSGETELRLLHQGVPLPDVRVVARSRDEPGRTVAARTDGLGRLRLTLDRPGVWMVKAVHLVETDPESTGADWQSLWASLTLERQGGSLERTTQGAATNR